MPSASDKLTIELPWREAVTQYWKRLLQVLYVAAANVLLLGLVVVLSLTVGLSAVGAALAAVGVAVGSLLTIVATSAGALAVGVVVGGTAWVIKHWLVSLAVVLLIVFLIAAFGGARKR